MFRRPSAVECFFCQSKIVLNTSNFNPRSFRCPECACWNRYDASGEIMSDEPAMHDAGLNARSFAMRASPRKDRILTSYRPGPFCHTCQTNQTLLINLRASFLPDLSDPEYERRLAALPEYERSLQARYPPVCASCASEVEERIAEKDRMARTSALRGLLRESKGKERARQVPASIGKRDKLELRLFAWKVRGCLWVATVAASIGLALYFISGRTTPQSWQPAMPVLPALVFFSVIWTFWDPSYSSLQKAYIQGRDIRLQGRSQYIRLQAVAWLSRLLSATLLGLPQYWPSLDPLHSSGHATSLRLRVYFGFITFLEPTILVASLASLRIHQPPQVRLLDTSRSRLSTPDIGSRSSTPLPHGIPGASHPVPKLPAFDPDSLLAPLTLSAQPIFVGSTQAHHPTFGFPSMGPVTSHEPAQPPMHVDADGDTAMPDDDAMDWAPLEPPQQPLSQPTTFIERIRQAAARNSNENVLLRPQRFFPPEQPTGLENLLARTGLTDIVSHSTDFPTATASGARRTDVRSTARMPVRGWHWAWVYAASMLPLAGVAWQAWSSRIIP